MRISRVNWGEVSEGRPSWSEASGRLWAIWPSPVDHDLCFESAGFTEFSDTDASWNSEFADLVGRLVDALENLGKATLSEGECPVARRRTLSSLRDALIAAATDDNFPPCVISFGAPAIASVRTSDGHAILWAWMAEGTVDPFLIAVAAGRELNEMTMMWERLA
jgi:hypothetical protein